MAYGNPLKRAARTAFHRTGGLRIARWIHRKGLRILMYHRFPNARGLEEQCRHLRECYCPLSLTEAAERLQSGADLPPNSVAITIDDGYRDFYATAWPVFSAYRLPVTIYVVTDFLDRRIWLWIDQVHYAFRHSTQCAFRMELPRGATLEFALGSEEQRRLAARQTCEALKLLPNEDRLAALKSLPHLLALQLTPVPPAGCEPLTWDEARKLVSQGVEFGAHTRTHPILSRVKSPAGLKDEIAGSKRRLEEVLAVPVRHFCYPNGAERDISVEAVETVRSAGYQTAVTTTTGLNAPGADLFRLRRIGVDPGYDRDYFQQCAAAIRV
jgi:peptidoglycan/xylan/chitin deacetylase (PgdA/CDA1 family)